MTNATTSGPEAVSISAARLSLAASVTAVSCLVGLHFVSPEFDPSWRVVSEYALGRHAWLLSLMFVAWGVGSAALAVAIWSQVKTLGGRIGLVLLLIASVGEAMASVFDLRQTVPHNLAAALGIPTLPIAATLLAASLPRSERWIGAKRLLFGMALLTWICLALMAAALFSLSGRLGVKVPIGWPNRLLVVTYSAWAMAVAWLALRVSRRTGDGTRSAPKASRLGGMGRG